MTTTATPRPAQGPDAPSVRGCVDPRGPQLAAALTAVVLAAVLLLPRRTAVALLAVQAVLFAVGAVRGCSDAARVAVPHARPPAPGPAHRLGGPRAAALRPGRGPRVRARRAARLRGRRDLVAQVAVGLALVAALLNAVFAFCLGCEVYLLVRRFIATV